MRVLIVDDEALARERLRQLLDGMANCTVVGEAADGMTALRSAEDNDPDVILLDIRMPGMDGLEAARHLAQRDPPPAIIFVTAYSDHALDAFAAHAVDYLLKPVRQEKLWEALRGAQRTTRAHLSAMGASTGPRTRLSARIGGSLEIVEVDAVHYFRADRKYVTVRHPDGELLIEDALRSLETEFGDRFLRIHRNALVAPGHVGGLRRSPGGRNFVWFRDIEDVLEVSRRHLASARRRLELGTR